MTYIVPPPVTHQVKGTKAFMDTTHSGLVPCIVLGYEQKSWFNSKSLLVEITKTVGPWKKGEITTSSRNFTPPRNVVRKRKYGSVIGYYRYQPE
jgi:hypothetical protein